MLGIRLRHWGADAPTNADRSSEAESAQLRPLWTLTTMSITIDPSSFCPGCGLRFCCCGSDPEEDSHTEAIDYSDDGPDLWPIDLDEDWLF